MPKERSELGRLLRSILGSKEVYFQRPESKKMNYPAIVYKLSGMPGLYADDGVYLSGRQYTVILIDKDPDSPFLEKIAALPACRFVDAYAADNLNHWVFTLSY